MKLAPLSTSAILLCLLSLPIAANAQSTYSYEGNTFDSADPPLTTSDRITGSFEVPSVLEPYLLGADISGQVTSFSFTDGQRVRNDGNSTVCLFTVSTDDRGGIIGWALSFRSAPAPAPGNPQQFIDTTGGLDQSGIGPSAGPGCGTISPNSIATNISNPGAWSNPDLPSPNIATYSYQGAPYETAVAPLTVGGSVTGSLTLKAPLPPATSYFDASVFLEDYFFTDGNDVYTPSNSVLCSFRIETDLRGDIFDWVIALRPLPQPLPGETTALLDSSSAGDLSGLATSSGLGICEMFSPTLVGQSNEAGDWNSSALPPEKPTTYQYDGAPFSSATGFFSVGQSITGSIAFPSPLPPNTDLDVTPFLADMQFTDGLSTRALENSVLCGFQLQTDADGEIVGWSINLREGGSLNPGDPMELMDITTSFDQSGVAPAPAGDICGTVSATELGESAPPDVGTWNRVLPPPPPFVPIPALSPWALIVFGLLLLLLSRTGLRGVQ